MAPRLRITGWKAVTGASPAAAVRVASTRTLYTRWGICVRGRWSATLGRRSLYPWRYVMEEVAVVAEVDVAGLAAARADGALVMPVVRGGQADAA